MDADQSRDTDHLLPKSKVASHLHHASPGQLSQGSSSNITKLTPRPTGQSNLRHSSAESNFDLLNRQTSRRRFSKILSRLWRSSDNRAQHSRSVDGHGTSPTNSSDTLDEGGDEDAVVVDFLPASIQKSSWKNKVAFYLDSTSTGRTWELFDASLNLIFCALYIWNTQYVDQGLPRVNRLLEFLFALVLLLQYLPRIFIAVDMRNVVLAPFTMLTFLASIPVFFAFNDDTLTETYLSAGSFAYVYPFRFLRLHLSFMTIMAPAKTATLKISLITRKSIRLLGFLFFMVLTVAAIVHMVAFKLQHATHLTFFDTFFFAIVSGVSGATTQIVPDGPFSRLVILYVMITGAIFIPKNLAELLTLISKRSPYVHSFKKKYHQNHVVVCGQFENYTLKTFLKEFFCPDHGSSTVNTHVVILNPKEPSEDLKEILDDPLYLNRVWYVKGSTLDPRSLEKVRIFEAAACFIFSSKYATKDASIDDSETVMRALALKKYARDLQLHVQVLLPENKCHFDYLAETMVCVEELKLGVLSQNCRCPGFTTLMYHLTTSLTEKNNREILASISNEDWRSWLGEYLDGASQEIYPTVLSHGLSGYTFTDVSSMIYHNFGAVLFGIGIPNKSYYQRLNKKEFMMHLNDSQKFSDRFHATDFDLHLNPPYYTVQGGEIAFVITRHDKVAKWIAEFRPQEVQEYMSRQPDPSFFTRWRERFSGKIRRHSQAPPEVLRHSTSSSYADLSLHSDSATIIHNPYPTSSEVKRLLTVASSQESFHSPNFVIPKNAVTRNELVPNDIFGDGAADVSSSVGAGRPSSPLKHANLSQQEQHEQGFVSRILQSAIGFHLYDTDEIGRMRSSSSSSSQTDLPARTTYCKTIPDHIENHILLCDASDSFPSNLEYFIAPLRAPHLYDDSVKWPSIVALSPGEPQEHQRKMLDKFDNVYVVHGSPLRRRDLSRAGVSRCKKAVILANASIGKKNPERTSDASVLLIVMNVEAMAMHEDVFIVTEFVHTENMQFIGESNLSVGKPGKNQEHKTLMRPAFMAGHVYAQSMLDTVICQSYYNPHLLNIMRHLLFSGIFHEYNLDCDEQLLPYMASHLRRHRSDETIAHPSKQPSEKVRRRKQSDTKPSNNTNSIPRDHEQAKPAQSGAAHHSHIWLLPVPSVLTGTSYGDLFAYASREMLSIPLGLYRKAPARMSESIVIGEDMTHANPTDDEFVHHYVHVNPSPEILLRDDDQVYLLSPHRPSWFR